MAHATTHEGDTDVQADLVESNDLLSDPAGLRRRLHDQGYLFFRDLLPAPAVSRVRHDIMGVLDAVGWLDRSHDLDAGVADREAYEQLPDDEAADRGVVVGQRVYREAYRLASFHRLAHHPALGSLYEDLFAEQVLVHPRTIARIMMPSQRTHPTAPHQDFIHVQGSDQTLTAWIPLGDCPRELGGLSVLAGSHREGLLSYRPSVGAGDLEAYLCDLDYLWRTADYRAGDVLTFTSQTVHRSLPQRLGDLIRLSVDYRYQPASQPIDAAALEPHVGISDWEEIYATWEPEDQLRYFWREQSPAVAPWNEDLRWQQERIC